jgi:tripartite-type tricarboxylate transporter receptor subunit TctC
MEQSFESLCDGRIRVARRGGTPMKAVTREHPFVRQRAIAAFILAGAFSAATSAFAADAYPVRPIRMIVGFPPGGGTDLVARIIQPRMSSTLGQQVIVENRPGANGAIGAELTARSTPDGYTLYFGHIGTLVITPAMQKVQFDTLKDFSAVAQVVTLQNIIVAHPGMPAKTLAELITLAKSRPGQINYATSGIGSPGHLAGALLETMASVKLAHIPYKGGGPAMTDVLAGHVPLSIGALPTYIQHVQSGKLRALGVTGARRSEALPEVPTAAEAGVPGYLATNWYGVVAPTQTPKAVVDRLNHAIVSALRSADVIESLKTRGIDPAPSSPSEFAKFMSSEFHLWGKLIRQAGIKAEF